jgi:Phage tail assembly chaperone proteins, E, or 41 or 14
MAPDFAAAAPLRAVEPATDPPGTVVMPLSRPIQAHGEVLQELRFHPLDVVDFMQQDDSPFIIDGQRNIVPIPRVMAKFISKLAQIPPSSVKALALHDFHNAQWIIVSFFRKPEPTS